MTFSTFFACLFIIAVLEVIGIAYYVGNENSNPKLASRVLLTFLFFPIVLPFLGPYFIGRFLWRLPMTIKNFLSWSRRLLKDQLERAQLQELVPQRLRSKTIEASSGQLSHPEKVEGTLSFPEDDR